MEEEYEVGNLEKYALLDSTTRNSINRELDLTQRDKPDKR